MARSDKPSLALLSCASALASTTLQGLAICSPWWVYIRQTFGAALSKYMNMGLFYICETVDNNITIRTSCHHCWSHPEFFSSGETEIMRHVAVSAPITSFVFSVVATAWCYALLKQCFHCNHGSLIISILFVLSGILSLTGFIAYANHINDMIGHMKNEVKEKAANVEDPFGFYYGASIFLLGISVVLSEVCGGINTAMFLSHYRSNYVYPLRQGVPDAYRAESNKSNEEENNNKEITRLDKSTEMEQPRLLETIGMSKELSMNNLEKIDRLQFDSEYNTSESVNYYTLDEPTVVYAKTFSKVSIRQKPSAHKKRNGSEKKATETTQITIV